ncbi:TPA: site-specific integrase [Vibrio alginolyticus]|nr:site-specific integrase [Vibrio alginolyticus]HCZ9295655.1 site-specific integrase [Vibrio alginolyticus]HCZ9298111.1 site-specific integrase [Vibrio alginolyticus]
MSVMATPWKHPKTGVFYFRRQVPQDIRQIIKKHEWKVSLKTKDLSVARPRFAAELARCEEIFAVSREQLAGRPKVLASDSPKLADRWASSVMTEWESNPDSVSDFLAVFPEGSVPAKDVIDADDYNVRAKIALPFIRKTLEHHNLPTPEDAEPAFKALVEAFFTRWVSLCDLAFRRTIGDWSSQMHVPAATSQLTVEREKEAQKSSAPSLSHVFQLWADDKCMNDGDNRSTQKTISDFGSTITRFIELFGDLPVNQINRAVCQDFRNLLGKFPAKGKGLRGLSAEQLMNKAEKENLPLVSLATIRKQLRAFSAILNFAVQRLNVMQEEPVSASGILRGIAKAAKRNVTRTAEDKQYSHTELKTIFQSPLFTRNWQPPKADFGEALYWLPLLMLYTGARREELCQLRSKDVLQDKDTGIWYLWIQSGEDQTVKTSNSIRKVPLHDDLIELGFIRYHQTLSTSSRLFPKLQPHPVNGYGHAIGKAWAKYLKTEVKLVSQASPSHGFRHTFKTLCREAGIETAVSDWITGHAATNVGATYGTNPLQRMASELKKFPSIAREVGLLR